MKPSFQLWYNPCADPGIFVRGGEGGPGQSDKKSLTSFFFFFFLVLSLFYRSQMVNFKEIYHFLRFQRGPTFSRGGGGVQLFSRGGGGSNCLFPIETHITCDFSGGSGPPVPPSGSALVILCIVLYLHLDFFSKLGPTIEHILFSTLGLYITLI